MKNLLSYQLKKFIFADDLYGIDFFSFFQLAACIFAHNKIIEFAANTTNNFAAMFFNQFFRIAALKFV